MNSSNRDKNTISTSQEDFLLKLTEDDQSRADAVSEMQSRTAAYAMLHGMARRIFETVLSGEAQAHFSVEIRDRVVASAEPGNALGDINTFTATVKRIKSGRQLTLMAKSPGQITVHGPDEVNGQIIFAPKGDIKIRLVTGEHSEAFEEDSFRRLLLKL